MSRTHDEPSTVTAHNGDVLLDGPGAVAVALTPAAAISTGEQLIEAATHAHGQRITGQVRDAD